MANFITVDHLGNSDPEGYVPFKQVQDAISALGKDDPRRQEKVDKLLQEHQRGSMAFQRAGHELANDVVARNVIGDQSSLEWAKFQRLYPIDAKQMQDKRRDTAYKLQRRSQIDDVRVSKDASGETRLYLDQLPSSQIKETTPDTVIALMRQNYHGQNDSPDAGEVAKTVEYLKRMQTGKMDPIEKQFNSIATQALNEAYKGDRVKVATAKARAMSILEDAHAADPKLGALDLQDKIKAEFTRGANGLFGSSLGILGAKRTGESYVRQPKKAPVAPGWYRKPDGTAGQWDGTKWVQ